MSHFTVVIATEHPDKIDELLAPYSENDRVEPYRDYEEGLPKDYWAVRSLREKGRITVPDEDLTWQHIIDAYTAEYGEEDKLFIDEDGIRAFSMSTYNPRSKWDWYSIGGRWMGYFPYAQENEEHVIHGQPGAFDNQNHVGHCDGGPKKYLDLAGLRAEQAEKARKEHRDYHRVVADTKPAQPWSVFLERAEATEGEFEHYTIEHAREDYHAQARIKTLRESPEFKDWWSLEPETFEVPEDEYAQRAADRAVPGYAVLTHEGQWMAPGQMGWWGMSSDDEASYDEYVKAANDYIDGLDDEMYLVMVDCHI